MHSRVAYQQWMAEGGFEENIITSFTNCSLCWNFSRLVLCLRIIVMSLLEWSSSSFCEFSACLLCLLSSPSLRHFLLLSLYIQVLILIVFSLVIARSFFQFLSVTTSVELEPYRLSLASSVECFMVISGSKSAKRSSILVHERCFSALVQLQSKCWKLSPRWKFLSRSFFQSFNQNGPIFLNTIGETLSLQPIWSSSEMETSFLSTLQFTTNTILVVYSTTKELVVLSLPWSSANSSPVDSFVSSTNTNRKSDWIC